MARIFRMPRPEPSAEELEVSRAKAMTAYQRSEWMRRFFIYGGMAALVGIGMLAEYLLTHP